MAARDLRWGSDGFARFTGSEAHETFADFGFVEGIGIEGTTTVPIGQFVVGRGAWPSPCL